VDDLELAERLRAHVLTLGDDVNVELGEGYVVFKRGGLEFAIVEPTAHHRLELGLHSPGVHFDDRFREAVGFGSRRITHRVSLPEHAEIDGELRARLRAAYALSAT
jgi:hypothetical protein